jgi:CelD/BcsL family acetyltransferase involved in cellulose biosynthesis
MTSIQASTAPPGNASKTIVVDDLDLLAPYLGAWDALAVAHGRPYCAPGWMLAWWREARSGDARLRVVLVLEHDRLAAVGPFFAQVGPLGLVEMRLLAAGFCHRIGLLALPGREASIAPAIARALAEMRPRPASVVFEGIDAGDPWPDLIAAAWPARRPARLRTDSLMDAPTIELRGSYEQWLARRDGKWRANARRTARRLGERQVRETVSADEHAIDALLDMHRASWRARGGSGLDDAARSVVAAAARELGPRERLTVGLLEGPDGPIAADLVVRAGTVAAGWTKAFDPAWTSYAPGIHGMLLLLRCLAERGVQTVDMGGGSDTYKRSLADGNSPLAWRTLFPRGARYPLMRLRLAPKHLFFALRKLARRLPREQRAQLKRWLRRPSRMR